MFFSYRRLRSARAALIGCAWLVAVGVGAAALLRYEQAPGEGGVAAVMWPEASSLARRSGHASLLVFAHPMCPCTSATLGELEAILHETGERAEVTVVFSIPTGTDDSWGDTALSRRAQLIPGVAIARDLDGAEANRFGAKTSGVTLLYSGDGKLLFRGGITDSRGHSGENRGRSAVSALLRGDQPETTRTHVFGCPLFTSPL